MLKRTVRGLIFAAVCLAALFAVNFFLPRLMPGDPLAFLIGADESGITQEEYDYYYSEMGLDKPLSEQFAMYIKGLFEGKLGYSYHHGRDVAEVIAEKIPRTLQIALPAWIICALLAYALGTRAGYAKSGIKDGIITSTLVAVDTVPTFMLAILLLVVFAYELGWLPFGALSSATVPDSGALAFLDRLAHLILPVSAMVLATLPKKYLLMRNVTANAMNEKYVVYAKVRGLSEGRIRRRHIFTNVGQPFISMLGTSFGQMLAGSIVVEMIFSVDGMGMLVGRAITDMDFPMLQAALTVIAVSVIVANFASDMICAFVNPKLRRGANV